MVTSTQPTADLQLKLDAGLQMSTASGDAKGKRQTLWPVGSSRIGASATKQILVVDDDPLIREFVAKTVVKAGFRADTAGDGETGWEALRRVAYDLVITDHEMPRLTGLKLIERIRAFSMEPPCILISGKIPDADLTTLQVVRPDVVLAKPFSPAVLIEKVYLLLLHGGIPES